VIIYVIPEGVANTKTAKYTIHRKNLTHCQLTTAVQPIPVQQIACPTAAVEAANGVGTHLFTTSTTDITLIDV